jgi:transposase
VSKGELVVNVDGKRHGGFANSREGLVKMRSIVPPGARIHLEASGGYDRLARQVFQEWGYDVQLHNPRKVRRMADGRGFTAKNDAMDAEALVDVGPLIKSKQAKSAEQEALCDISRTIKRLRDQIATNRRRMQTPLLPAACLKAYESTNRAAEKQIQALEKVYRDLVAKSNFQERYKLVGSRPGIGPATARVLSCELPANLQSYTPKQISSYGSMAPKDDESGKRIGPKRIKKGNVHIKAAMYMPAIWAIGHEDRAKRLYARLRQQGKTHDQAIIPIMRKMLVSAVAVIQRGSAWEPDPPRKNKFE